MNGMQFSRKWTGAALALALALATGATGYAVARATDAVSGTHVHASLKLADPSEGPSKMGFAPVVKEVLSERGEHFVIEGREDAEKSNAAAGRNGAGSVFPAIFWTAIWAARGNGRGKQPAAARAKPRLRRDRQP